MPAKSSIGASALALTATSTVVTYGVWIKAVAANATGMVYVGFADTVTAAAADATDGYQLQQGDEVFVSKAELVARSGAANLTGVYLIGSTTGLKVTYRYV